MKALIFAFIGLCAFIPSRLLVAILLPLWVAQRLLPTELQPLTYAGPIEVSPADLLIVLLMGRLIFSIAQGRRLVIDRPLYLALGIYILVNLMAALAAGFKFGDAQFARCTTSMVRFVSELSVLPIVAQMVKTQAQAKFCIRVLLGTLGALALIQFANYFGASRGIMIGEVQGLERGEMRCFGPVGDSVGVVLLLGYLASLCFANLPAAALFLGGILLTAGVGAIFATAVGTGVFAIFGTRTIAVREYVKKRLWLLPLIGLVGIVGAIVVARPMTATLLDRVGTGTYASSGAQRTVSAKLAAAMIADNPLLGVGYMGYERMLERYGGDQYFDLAHPDGATANANNQILQSLTDSGFIGLLAFGLLVFCSARLLWRTAARCDDRLIGTFFFAACLWLLTQLFGNIAAVWLNPASFVARLTWIALGLAVAVARMIPVEETRAAAMAPASTEPQPLAA